MAVSYGKLDPKWVEDPSIVEVSGRGESWWNGLDESTKIRMSMGLAWEAYYLSLLPGVVHQPGEMCVEGVFMTHDGESLSVIVVERKPKHVLIIHEVKLTYKSLNTVSDISKEWLWLMQMKGYCKGRSTTHAMLHVLFVAGDYSHPLSPQKRIWQFEFTQQEIDDAWELAMNHRAYLERQERENALKDTH